MPKSTPLTAKEIASRASDDSKKATVRYWREHIEPCFAVYPYGNYVISREDSLPNNVTFDTLHTLARKLGFEWNDCDIAKVPSFTFPDIFFFCECEGK